MTDPIAVLERIVMETPIPTGAFHNYHEHWVATRAAILAALSADAELRAILDAGGREPTTADNLLIQLYEQIGNHRDAHRRLVVTASVRDATRDYLKSKGLWPVPLEYPTEFANQVAAIMRTPDAAPAPPDGSTEAPAQDWTEADEREYRSLKNLGNPTTDEHARLTLLWRLKGATAAPPATPATPAGTPDEDDDGMKHWREFEPKMCPFCGGSGSAISEPDRNSKGQLNGAWHAYVRCMWCDCRTSAFGNETREGAETRALEVWNARKYATREWGIEPAPTPGTTATPNAATLAERVRGLPDDGEGDVEIFRGQNHDPKLAAMIRGVSSHARRSMREAAARLIAGEPTQEKP